jgi:hypothetical protein
MTVINFYTLAESYLKNTYGLNVNDLDITDNSCYEAMKSGKTPQQYIDSLAGKYGLIKKKDFTFQKTPKKFISRLN